jgi:hypothetical protein
MSRKFGGFKPRVVEVVCVDTSSPERGAAKLIRARWPAVTDEQLDKTKGKPVAVAPSGATTSAEIMRVPVSGITDTARLTRIAKGIYEEVSRGEIGGSVETKALASWGGDNLDPDLLRLKPGDAVEMVTDVRRLQRASPLVAQYVDDQRRSENEEVEALMERMDDRTLATAIVRSSRSGALPRFFYVQNVKYDWKADSGIGVAFDYQNYVDAGQTEAQGATPAEAGQAVATGAETGARTTVAR